MIKKLSILFLLFSSINAYTQCNSSETKIMVMGDSWAFFSWQGDSYNENLKRFGFTDIKAESNIYLSVNGTRASNFFNDSNRKDAVQEFIATHSELEFVHFSLGGNDFLGEWNKNMTTQQEDSLLNFIVFEIRESLDTVFSYNPDLSILFSGYDYPNFAETVGTLSPSFIQELHPFFDLWDDMGQPTHIELNELVLKAINIFEDSIATWDNVSFVNNLGLMQNLYGQTSNLGAAPYGTYPANTAPVPGGFPTYPSPLAALNFDGLDAFHLNDNAYEKFIKRHFEEFYWEELRNAENTIYANDTSLNSSISENSIDQDNLIIGNILANKSKSILTFNIENLSEDSILDASIFIQRNNLVGTNLNNEELTLDIKNNYFGSSVNIELEDFDNESDTSAIACTYGTVSKNDFWYRIDLPDYFLSFINKEGTTQFRLEYDLVDSDRYLSFNKTENAIFLDLKYNRVETPTEPDPIEPDSIEPDPIEPDPTAITETQQTKIGLYPNPSKDFINLDFEGEFKKVVIKDVLGKVVLQTTEIKNIQIQHLKKGIYFLTVESSQQTSAYKFIKE